MTVSGHLAEHSVTPVVLGQLHSAICLHQSQDQPTFSDSCPLRQASVPGMLWSDTPFSQMSVKPLFPLLTCILLLWMSALSLSAVSSQVFLIGSVGLPVFSSIFFALAYFFQQDPLVLGAA